MRPPYVKHMETSKSKDKCRMPTKKGTPKGARKNNTEPQIGNSDRENKRGQRRRKGEGPGEDQHNGNPDNPRGGKTANTHATN